MQSTIRNQLSAVRRSRGLGAAELARRVGVSRQTIYAIEAGSYVPNTEVSLKLGRALDVRVDELFSLEPEEGEEESPLRVEVLSAQAASPGQAVQVCAVGDRMVSVPVNAWPYFMAEADGVVAKAGSMRGRAEVAVTSKEDAPARRLVVAGCDPAIGLLARMAQRVCGVEVIAAPASSTLALGWLKEAKVHIAGTHLKDARTGEFNVPIIRREFPDEEVTIVTFARWEEGFVTAPGNPKRIRKASDLARRNVRIVNREPGSGSRALLDRILTQAGVESSEVTGYGKPAHGHLDAAYLVHAGEADCCVATHSAARSFGLDFVALEAERYDLVLRRSSLELPAVEALLDVLQRAALRRKLAMLAGYDTAETGAVIGS